MCLEVGCRKQFAATDEYGALYKILQLAYVAGVGQAAEVLQCIGRKFRCFALALLCQLCCKVLGEQRYVLASFAQCGKVYVYEVYSPIEVLAEGVLVYHLPEIGICGAHHADVYFARAAVTEHFVGLFLKHTQEFHLTTDVEFAYFVEEDCAAMCHFEASHSVARCVGEGSAFVAEHFALEERL